MKLIQIISLLTLSFFLVFNLSFVEVLAQSYDETPEPPSFIPGCSPGDTLRRCMLGIAHLIIRVILVVALIFSAIMMAWAGILYITSGEKEEERKKVRNRIIYAAVGLVVAFLAWAITRFLAGVLQRGAI